MNNNNYYNKGLKANAQSLRKQGVLSEVLLWWQLKGRKMSGVQFLRQRSILSYIVDFYCPELKLVIEIDGASHGDKITEDKERDARLKAIGIDVIRISDLRVKRDMESVVIEILEKINSLKS